jgi:MtfA peptidase
MSKKTLLFASISGILLFIWLLSISSTDAQLLEWIVAVGLIYYFANNSTINTLTTKSLSPAQKVILNEFKYYSELADPAKKLEFERRVSFLVHSKNFLGKKELVITEKMKVLIASTIAQIGFGYSFITLEHFEKIIIYPKAYYSGYSKRYHKGEVNAAGVIVLSWEDFLQGFNISDDGYNVGLHEIAHAFRIEDAIPNSEYQFIKERDLDRWHKVSEVEYDNIRAGKPSFIRNYAGSNRQEFFAVCVEQFFEQAEAFQKALPELYTALALVLKQDPLQDKR